MKIISGIGQLNRRYRRVVAAIGVFDSVHRGHQRVIRRAVDEARRLGGTSFVITFHPHPVSVLRPKRFSAYVLSLSHRVELVKAFGADVCLIIRFNRHLARMSAGDFIRKILVKRLGVREVIVGEDFHFGHDQRGSVEFLKEQGKQFGFKVISIPTKKEGGVDIKTSFIKELVKKGELRSLRKMLGRHYSILARVKHGEKLGRRLGFPTANLNKENVIIPPSGIYCVRVVHGRKKMNGVFYIGTRPSIKHAHHGVVLEAHILDYSGDLYGQDICVEFLKKIREDKKFPDEKSLALQIARDVRQARSFFRGHPID